MAKEKKSTQQPSRKGDGQRINRSWDTPSRPITPTPADSVPPDTPAKPQPAPKPADTPAKPQPAPKPADTPAKPQPRDKK